MIDLDRFPKGYDIDEHLWRDEGEWRKFMVCVYTMSEVKA